MNKKKIIILSLLSLLLILAPILAVLTLTVALPPAFSDSFYGALNEKYDRLNSVEGKKVVVVGGSSVAFGLDSAALEEYLGMPVVNFGLYAALGTKLMLDLSDSAINEGDIVILAPELDGQMLSMYFNPQATLRALDDDYSLIWDVDSGDIPRLLYGSWEFLGAKWSRLNGGATEDGGIYRSEYFNEYGDFALARYENTMELGYDPNGMINLKTGMLGEGADEFFDYLNGYIRRAQARGAKVFFSWCPMNERGISGTDSERAALVEYLEGQIDCPFISTIDDYILGAGYFYDTNLHLNIPGVQVRTLRLAYDIKAALGDYSIVTDKNGNIVAEEYEPLLPGSGL